MASACVNSIGVSPESFLDFPPAAFPAYGWLGPGISFGREDNNLFSSAAKPPHAAEASDPFRDFGDFEFRLDDPVTMLPADQLFSDGKLVPLQLTAARSAPATADFQDEKKSGPDNEAESVSADPYLISPKAPRCSSYWRELLGLRKLHHKAALMPNATTSSSSSSSNTTGKSIRNFLQRSSKSDVSLNVHLLKDSDCESHSISSSRHSLSSSSSGHDLDDLPRLSLDADIKSCRSRSSSGPSQGSVRPRVKMAKPRMVAVAESPKPLIDHPSAPTTINRVGRSPMPQANQDPASTSLTRAVSVDSPRLSSSGKIVFYGLERSSSSPSTFNGGPRYKHRGMERSYSANVRVTPVLNVPLCKSGVFGLFSSQSSQKKEGNNSSSGSSRSHHHHHSSSGSGRIRRVESN